MFDISHLLPPLNLAFMLFLSDHSIENRCMIFNTIYEGSNQTIEGRIAIMEVVQKRKEHPYFPSTLCGVIYQPSQFSWTIDGHKVRDLNQREISKGAQLVYAFYNKDDFPKTSVYGSTNFINTEIADYIPNWYYTYEFMGRIDDHEFFRRPNKGETILESKRKIKPPQVKSK